ncbi:sporulation protein YabP [Frisingicoccus sp.]|uniref:sporulation protein YabP n=1 Tax=Frisingicoccus sp. TaxID=1918627 RepID=UPI002EBAA3D4|nr:sporulation protein YabP [Frisingicoccus sp.]
MEERLGGKNHKLVLLNRVSTQMTGVLDVISFDTNEIVMDTEEGLLMIRGEDLHVNHLTLEKGEVHIDGHVDSLVYSNSQKMPKNHEKGFSRFFR